MPRTAELEPLVTRVLAPNPSGMTLDGTNTYLVGVPGGGQAVLVDPGPDDPAHLAAVEAAQARRHAPRGGPPARRAARGAWPPPPRPPGRGRHLLGPPVRGAGRRGRRGGGRPSGTR